MLENRIRPASFLQLPIHTVNPFTELTDELIFFHKGRNLGIAGEVCCPHIIEPYPAGQNTGALHRVVVVEQLNLDIRSEDGIVAMGNCIDNQFRPAEFGILRLRHETCVLTKISSFFNLRFYKSNGRLSHIQDSALEGNILNNIHFPANLFHCPLIPDETDMCPLEKALWVFSEQKYGSAANLFLAILGQDIISVGTKKSQCILLITNPLAVTGNKVQVQVLNCCPCNGVILIVLHPFGQHNLHTVIKGQPF